MNRRFEILFLLLLFFLWSKGFSQSWHPFPGGNTFAYQYAMPGSSGTHVLAVKFDSAKVEGLDSAFYHYRCLRELETTGPFVGCNNQQQYFSLANNVDHFLGQKVLLAANGDCRLVFSAGDTFLIRTRAAIAESWNWTASVSAVVDSIVAGNVLGIADSLKYVSLSNGKRIVLSRSMGCVEIPFPQALSGGLKYINSSLSLDGIHERGLGFRIPFGFEWLKMETGTHAVRHSYHLSYGLGGASTTSDVEFWVDSVIDYGTYLVVHKHQQSFTSYWSYNGGTSTSIVPYQAMVDTIREENYPHFFRLPFQMLPALGAPIPYPYHQESQVPVGYHKWSEDSTHLVMVTGNFILLGDTCVSGLEHFWGNYEHLSGFGAFNSVTDDPYGWSESYMETRCIESPTIHFGTCPVVLENEPQETMNLASISVFPNPTTGPVTIDGLDTRFAGEFEVWSVEGKRLFGAHSNPGSRSIGLDLSALGPGLFFLRFLYPGKEPYVCKVLIIE